MILSKHKVLCDPRREIPFGGGSIQQGFIGGVTCEWNFEEYSTGLLIISNPLCLSLYSLFSYSTHLICPRLTYLDSLEHNN